MIYTQGAQYNDEEVNETTLELLLNWMTNIHSHLIAYKDDAFLAPLIEDTIIVDNNTSGKGKFEDPNFAKIRTAVGNFTSKKLIVETPVSWVLFRKVIQQY